MTTNKAKGKLENLFISLKTIFTLLVEKRVGLIFLVFLVHFLQACKTPPQEPIQIRSFVNGQKPKNIILMIGDGMGLGLISAAIYSSKTPLNIERFPVIGFQKTYAHGNLVTDSAAGATAIACGEKTFNNAIGVAADSIACKTILEEAEENGLATGLISTSSIVHATPGSFIAHQMLRGMYEGIASDILDSEVDFLVGGGKKYFDRRANDSRNLYKELEEKGYEVYDYFYDNIKRITVNPTKNFVFFTADAEPLSAKLGRDYLPFASRLGANFLEQHNEEGFFLMIEGSQIDWEGHYNSPEGLLSEFYDFDEAIGNVLRFANSNLNTLVIITADHETSGLSIVEGSKLGKIEMAFTGKGGKAHTGTMVPVFAYGPGAEAFSGIYENTAIHDKMRHALGFDD